MKTQHTESPWKVVELPAKNGVPATHEVQYGEDGECVAEWVHKKEDAKLIAAAPDLLEALINLCATDPNASNWDYAAAFSAAQTAIKKATE
jgi:hypothetical protein